MNDAAAPRGNIVIVGGGFAGTTLARELGRRLPTGYRLVLISEESYTTFNPMLAEVVSASVFPEHVVAPIRQILVRGANSQFIMGRVTDVDMRRKRLVASTLAGMQTLGYAQLVFAFGRRANMDLIPGLAQHALPLKLVGDAMAIRNRVLQRVARIELENDPAKRRWLGHFIVIGGGFSGVEVAGGLADFLREARRYYPRVAPDELQVTVLHNTDRLLPELPDSLGDAAAASLRARQIALRLGVQAVDVTGHGVQLANGDFLVGATVVSTIGTSANALVTRLALATQHGQIVTGPDMAVAGQRAVWAIGDCARVHNRTTGTTSPPTAQFAVAQARSLAHNLLAVLRGQGTRAFGHRSRGMMATTGHLKGVALLLGLRLTGLPAWLLWRAYYLLQMPTPGRKLRIWVEWTWGMFFSADITHLRFTRTQNTESPHDLAPDGPTHALRLSGIEKQVFPGAPQ